MTDFSGFSQWICAFCSIILMFGFHERMMKRRRSRLFFFMLGVSTVMYLSYALMAVYHPEPADVKYIILQILVFSGYSVLLFVFTVYLLECIRMEDENILNEKEPVRHLTGHDQYIFRIVRNIVFASALFNLILWIITIFNGKIVSIHGATFEKGPWYMTGQAGGVIVILCNLFLLVRYREIIGIRQTRILSAFPLIPVLAAWFEQLFPGIAIRNQCIFLSLLLIYTHYHQETEQELERKETALLKRRVELMAARMQPHYIYNVLSTIYYLCVEDPQKAQEATGLFSEYLRNTLDVMKRQELVPLSWERSTITSYLKLEKIRFGNRIQVDYHTTLEDDSIVYLPPFTVQPLVENAVRHGLSEKNQVVNIRIDVEQLPDRSARIRICDDGAGYVEDQVDYGEGILNVRERLRMQCGGSLDIQSQPGQGTTAIIMIPVSEEWKEAWKEA